MKLQKQNIRKYFAAHQKLWKIFDGLSIYTSGPPQKPFGPPPTYLMILNEHYLISITFFFEAQTGFLFWELKSRKSVTEQVRQ